MKNLSKNIILGLCMIFLGLIILHPKVSASVTQEKNNKEENILVDLKPNESIEYRMKRSKIGSIATKHGRIHPEIMTEAMVVVNGEGEVVRVIDFGSPVVFIEGHEVEWKNGGFNIDRQGEKKARISSTGQFIIKGSSVKVGFDVIDIYNLEEITEVRTIDTILGW